MLKACDACADMGQPVIAHCTDSEDFPSVTSDGVKTLRTQDQVRSQGGGRRDRAPHPSEKKLHLRYYLQTVVTKNTSNPGD